MNYSLSSKKITLVFLSIAMVLTLGRLVKGRGDFSYFITAGADFTDRGKTPTPVIVQPGQGYDGQFFYRYALAPTDFIKNDHGVNVDHPPYRIQRIAYPFLAWLLSFGGIPFAVPIALVLLNILAFLGISFFTNRFIALVNGNVIQGLLPLLLCGIYMSIARDLSEVLELFFFTGTVYYLFKPRYLLFAVFATCTILSRETSMIALIPLTACLVFREMRKGFQPRLFYLCLPFLVFIAWKAVIYINVPSLVESNAGYGSVSFPFKGIVQGFNENFNLSGAKNILQFIFWIAYLCWQVFFLIIMFGKAGFKQLYRLDDLSLLKIIYLGWFVFVVCFSVNIYGDDWGFVRIFSMWNMIGFLILIASKKQTGWLFNSCSAVLVLLTIIRLIIRV